MEKKESTTIAHYGDTCCCRGNPQPGAGHTTARRRIWKRAKRNKAEDQVHKQLPSPKIVCAETHPESPTRNNHPGHQLTMKEISHPTPINMPLID